MKGSHTRPAAAPVDAISSRVFHGRMRITTGQLEAARGHSVAVRPPSAAYAPTAVVAALTALVGDPWQVKASSLTRDVVDRSTTWTALWLTSEHLARVEARHADDPDWDGESHQQQETEPMRCWLRLLTDLRSIDATMTTGPAGLTSSEDGWVARPHWTLTFTDGATVALPTDETSRPADSVDDFVAAVRTAWTTSLRPTG